MKAYIEDRVKEVAIFMIESKSTIRETAKVFNVSKSTVHKDIVERLPYVQPQLCEEVQKLIEVNKEERAFRGGLATMIKYDELKKEVNQ